MSELSDADLAAIEAAEIKAGLDWNLENAHPLLMAIGPLRRAYERERRRADEAEARATQYANDALEDIAEWSSYASSYFAEKWDLQGCLEMWRKRAGEADR